jgi:precorrin-3B C17-methyltransferase
VKTAIITLSEHGARLARQLAAKLGDCRIYVHSGVASAVAERGAVTQFEHITDVSRELFDAKCGGLVYIAPTGLVVRAIAPCIKSKLSDPAVVVVDVGGRWSISLLSGHEGGANELAMDVANALAAEPVVTTTTEAAKDIIIGVGCRKGVAAGKIIQAIRQALAAANVPLERVRMIASADIKSGEAGLLEACTALKTPLRLVSSDEIRGSTAAFTRSEFVEAKVNLPAVAEPCALLSGTRTRLLLPKQKYGDVTVALAQETVDCGLKEEDTETPATAGELRRGDAEKRRGGEGERGRAGDAEKKPDGRAAGTAATRGKLYVVGIGPGGAMDRTRRAEAAIAGSGVLVGYSMYLEQVRDLSGGKELISSGMRQEVHRCRQAIERAREGLTVALISSGDAGVYGMAGLAIELANAIGGESEGKGPADKGRPFDIEIVPGMTAATSAAARLGAPLMLDFAVISLSDLLIPWQTIRGRVEALAGADMVMAIYNPRSTKRVKQLEETVEILLRHRPPQTPVGIARAVGSDEERIQVTTLGDLLAQEIDMRTVLIIGNSMSRVVGGWLVTCRGYHI